MKEDNFFKFFIRGDLKLSGVKKIDLWGVEFGADIPTITDPSRKFTNEFNRQLAKELRKNNIPMPCGEALLHKSKVYGSVASVED